MTGAPGTSTPVIRLRGLTRRFGGITAVGGGGWGGGAG
jgi:hypothetical protein